MKRVLASAVPGRSDTDWWIGDGTPADLSFIVQTASHVAEAVAASRILQTKGVSSRLFSPSHPRGATRRLRRSFHRAVETEKQLSISGASHGEKLISSQQIVQSSKKILVFNDWGAPRDLVALANKSCVETIGWVEGFQDFLNCDNNRDLLPYQQVEQVLGLLPIESSFFGENRFTLIGSHRLARFAKSRIPLEQKSIDVLVNLNFSYGVPRSYARNWAGRVVRSCDLAQRTAVFSRHALDRERVGYRYKSIGPLGDFVGQTRVLITRSGSALLEGLAAGCEVIFFNPNGERAAKYLLNEFPQIREVTTDNELTAILKCQSSTEYEPAQIGIFDIEKRSETFYKAVS